MILDQVIQAFESASTDSVVHHLLKQPQNTLLAEFSDALSTPLSPTHQLYLAIALRQYIEAQDPQSIEMSSFYAQHLDQYPWVVSKQLCVVIANALNPSLLQDISHSHNGVCYLREVAIAYLTLFGDHSDLPLHLGQFALSLFERDPCNSSVILCHYLQYCHLMDRNDRDLVLQWSQCLMRLVADANYLPFCLLGLINVLKYSKYGGALLTYALVLARRTITTQYHLAVLLYCVVLDHYELSSDMVDDILMTMDHHIQRGIPDFISMYRSDMVEAPQEMLLPDDTISDYTSHLILALCELDYDSMLKRYAQLHSL